MTIPSTLDRTLAPPGGHVIQLFTQYTPYKMAGGQQWTDDMRNKYADTGLLLQTHQVYCKTASFSQ